MTGGLEVGAAIQGAELADGDQPITKKDLMEILRELMSDRNQGGPSACAVLAVPEPFTASFGFRACFWSKALRGYGRLRRADLHTNVHVFPESSCCSPGWCAVYLWSHTHEHKLAGFT